MFSDVSGFGTTADALMEHGRYGAEVLATILRGVFESLEQCVHQRNGFIVSLAGDAFAARFLPEAISPPTERFLQSRIA